ncbi:MAG: hypothetical protein ABH872_01310 [Candidatus Omnitrophota bacterium]
MKTLVIMISLFFLACTSLFSQGISAHPTYQVERYDPEEFDPFPQNRGTVFEYSQDDIPEICFFPVDKARWDGTKITAEEWPKLTDHQEVMFVGEYIEGLEKELNTDIEFDPWGLSAYLNKFVAGCPDEYLDTPMTMALHAFLVNQGKIEEKAIVEQGPSADS